MISGEGKYRVKSACLIIFIFIAAFLPGCSGCSKSGLWVVENQLPPWAVRTLHNMGISTKGLFNIQEGQN
jgi:hypothetical protein